jgi:RNA polymerase sigma-70 factor (ECF subfamily)
MKQRSNGEWLDALQSEGPAQATAIAELRALLLRAARYALSRHPNTAALAPTDLDHLAEDAAQDALSALLPRLADFRGESRFTTWAYTFAVHAALVTARRERWGRISLDVFLQERQPAHQLTALPTSPDPQRRALQAEVLAVLGQAVDTELTPRQRQALLAIVVDEVPLDELARHWASNRNALYKLLHDARRKLKARLRARGFDAKEMLDAFGDDR